MKMRSLLHYCSLLHSKNLSRITAGALGTTLVVLMAGCASTPPTAEIQAAASQAAAEPVVLREGDVIRLTFPGAANHNTVAAVRRDGVINLDLVGEVRAAGMTPADLQKELVRLYTPHLVERDVVVSVESSGFPVFITGAVLRPGKVVSSRPLTALEAIMEAGGFDYTRANLKSVTVIRNVEDRMVHFRVNLKKVLDGEGGQPFYLKPSDIVYVPERFTWF